MTMLASTSLIPTYSTRSAVTAEKTEARSPVSPIKATMPDPFRDYHKRILQLHEIIDNASGRDDEEAESMMQEWKDIDKEALSSLPQTISGAAGAIEYAMREFIQFYVEGPDREADESSRLILHLLSGALAVQRQAVANGAP